MVSLTPAPPTVTRTPAPSRGRSPVSLVPPSPPSLGTAGLAGTAALAAGAAAVTSAPLFPHPSPRLRTTERQRWAVPHWPARPEVPSPWPLLPGPRPRHHPGLGKAFVPGPQGPAGGLGRTARGATPGWAVCPVGCPAQPHVLSVPLPTGRHLTRRMPPRASRAAVCGVARSPPAAGLAHPPLPSAHSLGRFFADF